MQCIHAEKTYRFVCTRKRERGVWRRKKKKKKRDEDEVDVYRTKNDAKVR